MNSWIYLIIAGIFEMGWVISLELSQNFTKINYIVLTTILLLRFQHHKQLTLTYVTPLL